MINLFFGKLYAQIEDVHFIDNISVTMQLGGDRYSVDKNRWPELWRNQRSVNYKLDSLIMYEPDRNGWALRLPKIDVGIRVQVIKDLLRGSTNKLLHRKIQLSAGLGLYQTTYKQDPLTNNANNYFTDTNKVYVIERLSFTQKRLSIDLNQALTYNFNSVIKNMKHFIGVGYLLQNEVSSNIYEDYHVDTNRYNRTYRRFESKTIINTQEKVQAKRFSRLKLYVPFGLTFKLAHRNDFIFEVDYSYSKNKYSDVNKKNEAWRMQFGYSYNFSR